VLLYAAVAMTLISGVDYFLGFRRRLDERRPERSPEPVT
jgi:hypothetical protein